jgi:hypothetical protein
MSVLDQYKPKNGGAKTGRLPKFLGGGDTHLEELHPQTAEIGNAVEQEMSSAFQEIQESRRRGTVNLDSLQKPTTLPPTAGNIYAGIAVDLLKKREEIIREATVRAQELDQLANEMISCGVRVQDFMAHSQRAAQAIKEAKPIAAASFSPEIPTAKYMCNQCNKEITDITDVWEEPDGKYYHTEHKPPPTGRTNTGG